MKKIITLLLVVSILVFTGCATTVTVDDNTPQGADNTPANNPTAQAKNCAAEPNTFVQVACYSEQAVAAGDVSVCDNIDVETGKNSCINDVAQDKKDKSLCMLMDGEMSQIICLTRINEQTNDPTVCDELEGIWKSQCEAAIE